MRAHHEGILGRPRRAPRAPGHRGGDERLIVQTARQRVLGSLLCVVAGLSAGCAGASPSGGSAPNGSGGATNLGTWVTGTSVTGTSATGTSATQGDRAGMPAEVFRRFFSTDRDWLARGLGGPSFGGRPYCGVDVLGTSADARHAYVWVVRQEFYLSGGQVKEGTAVSAPVLVTVSGSRDGTTVTSWRMPQDGSAWAGDAKVMFPAAVAARALAQDVHPSPSLEQLKVVADRDLSPGPVDESAQVGAHQGRRRAMVVQGVSITGPNSIHSRRIMPSRGNQASSGAVWARSPTSMIDPVRSTALTADASTAWPNSRHS